MRQCKEIEKKFATSQLQQRLPLRKLWHKQHCADFTLGDRLVANRTHKLIFDIGFHSGDDTLYFLERGYDVVAVDANPAMIIEGLARPALRLAARTGQLRAISSGIVRRVEVANQTLPFYIHRRVTEWSTFNIPADKAAFDTVRVPLTTCGGLIRQFGTPFYMKVDIEGYDEACLASLEHGRMPAYLSTEDPLQLDRLIRLGYRTFKMVSQKLTRRGDRQFSGGLSETAPGQWGDASSVRTHPFYSEQHMHVRIDVKGRRFREEHDLHARLV